jgi:hypothetical protein
MVPPPQGLQRGRRRCRTCECRGHCGKKGDAAQEPQGTAFFKTFAPAKPAFVWVGVDRGASRDGHAGQAGMASTVGAAESGAKKDGHAGQAGMASTVGAAESGALGSPP